MNSLLDAGRGSKEDERRRLDLVLAPTNLKNPSNRKIVLEFTNTSLKATSNTTSIHKPKRAPRFHEQIWETQNILIKSWIID